MNLVLLSGGCPLVFVTVGGLAVEFMVIFPRLGNINNTYANKPGLSKKNHGFRGLRLKEKTDL